MHGVFCEGREIVNRRFIRRIPLTFLRRQRGADPAMQVAAHLASPIKCVRLSPSPVADFDIDGVPGRGT
jgi:hypothetical protein